MNNITISSVSAFYDLLDIQIINSGYDWSILISTVINSKKLYCQNKFPLFNLFTEAIEFLQHYPLEDCLFESNYYLVTEEFNMNKHSFKEGDLLLIPTYENVNTQFFRHAERLYKKYKEEPKVYSLDRTSYDTNKVISYM